MGMKSLSYIPGCVPDQAFFLDNFIPPLNGDIFLKWIEREKARERLIIDPISANPFLAITLAQKGCRVLAARGNPITWMITEIASGRYKREDIS